MARLPELLSASDATWINLAQLFVLVLVAAVSFVRSSQRAISPSFVLLHAFRRCIAAPTRLALHSFREVVINGAIGVLALGARFAVILASLEMISSDRGDRLVVSELVGCTASLLHFVLRNVVLRTELASETPLTKLGGPMSQIDVSAAILVSLAETPLLASRESFASVGRMLASLLILVSGLQTLIFSCVACAMTTFCVFNEQGGRGYAVVLLTSTLLWLTQTACVAVTLCTSFVYPFVFSLSRTTAGSTVALRLCLLFGVCCVALPMVNRVTLSFARSIRAKLSKGG